MECADEATEKATEKIFLSTGHFFYWHLFLVRNLNLNEFNKFSIINEFNKFSAAKFEY